MKTWSVYGKITGPALPTSQVRIGDAIVGPPSAGFSVPDPGALNLEWHGDVTSYAAHGPRMEIRTDCWVLFENLSLPTMEAAIEHVESVAVPRLVGALSHRSLGAPYRISIVGAGDGEHNYSDGAIIHSAFYEKTALSTEWVTYAHFRAACIGSNDHLSLASELFHRGIRCQDLAAGRLTLAASVLAFYQVLEACARIPPWTPPLSYEQDRARILTTAKANLNRKSTPAKQATTIQTAAVELNRLDNRYGDHRILHAAEHYGLDKAWRSRARDLGKLRNRSLGHASKLASTEDLRRWEVANEQSSESAAAVAATILDAAIDYVGGSGLNHPADSAPETPPQPPAPNDKHP